jgi:hypothetical protein
MGVAKEGEREGGIEGPCVTNRRMLVTTNDGSVNAAVRTQVVFFFTSAEMYSPSEVAPRSGLSGSSFFSSVMRVMAA